MIMISRAWMRGFSCAFALTCEMDYVIREDRSNDDILMKKKHKSKLNNSVHEENMMKAVNSFQPVWTLIG